MAGWKVADVQKSKVTNGTNASGCNDDDDDSNVQTALTCVLSLQAAINGVIPQENGILQR